MNNVNKAAAMMGGGQANMNLGMLGMIQLNDEMKAALGDEMDLIIFDPPDLTKDITGPQDFNAAVMMPVVNRSEVKKMLGMVGGMAGFNVDKPEFSTADWSFYPLMGTTAAIGLSNDWLVLTTNYKKFMPIAQKAPYAHHAEIAKGNSYIRIDMNRLYREMGMPLITKMKVENPKLAEKEIAFFFDITPQTDLGYITMTERHEGLKCISTMTMNDDVYNIFGYLMSVVGEDLAMKQMGLFGDKNNDYEEYQYEEPAAPAEAGGRDDEIPLQGQDFGDAKVPF
jgi:hypothetical protein